MSELAFASATALATKIQNKEISAVELLNFFLASHWIINSARSRSGKSMADCLALELISAANNEGGAIKKKEDTHRMAEANRAFAHFR